MGRLLQMTRSWAWARGDDVGINAHVYRSLGPLIQFNMHSEYGEVRIHLTPIATFRFALGLIRVCCYAWKVKVKLIIKDLRLQRKRED